ncbi:MAG: SapC family protein [Hyphomicrobiales bacterium]|nr:SapC family protein [Hyphomicrobiales bacterium]
MANPLFYQNIVPLNRETHRTLRLKALARPLDYARLANMVPALTDEFAAAAQEIPIAFLPGTAQPAAVFVTGLKPGRNAFITEDGRWNGSYVPAYLRRYPFIIGDVPDADPILCIDANFEGFGEVDGTPLFSQAGEPEPAVTQALALANNYRAGAERTDALALTLQRLGLFRSVTLDAKLPNGESTVVHGLLIVDEQAFNALSDEQFLELRSAGFLQPIYAHLFSLAAISKLTA